MSEHLQIMANQSGVSAAPVAFGAGQSSRTSIVVAALRAFGAREPDPAVRNPDWLAERLLSPDELALIASHPVARALKQDYRQARESREVCGMSNLLLVRTRFVDERFRRALENGVAQVVILGAGFDTRAYRFRDGLKDGNVFEVDYRSTQEVKKRRLKEAGIEIPPQVHFAEIDFKKDSLQDVLFNAGYKAEKKSLFIWEGVSMYLPESVVRGTLRTLNRCSAAGSTLVMDFAEQSLIDLLRDFPQLSQHTYTTAWGEPWIFGSPDNQERQFFKECGLELGELVSMSSPEMSKRYLTRSDGTSLGSIGGGHSPMRRRLTTKARVLWRLLTRRSRWYAMAGLTTTGSS